MKTLTLALEEINIVADEVLKSINNGVVILRGDLAAGKTTLVKAIVKKLSLDNEVTSPTFSIQQCYGDSVFHYDIYNHGVDHFISLGMLEELDKEGLHFIEWGDDALIEILNSVGIDCLVVDIQKVSLSKREYKIKRVD